MKPLVLETSLLPFTHPIKDAGERIGASLEAWRISNLPWWKRLFGYEHYKRAMQMQEGWGDYDHAFDVLHAHIIGLVNDAYQQGREDQRKGN